MEMLFNPNGVLAVVIISASAVLNRMVFRRRKQGVSDFKFHLLLPFSNDVYTHES
jgi:hypothetical protein